MKHLFLVILFFAMGFISSQTTGSISPVATVTIGTQVWSSENLNVIKFRNGDAIPLLKTDAEWAAAEQDKKPGWCYYNNDAANGVKYHKLYNWYAVNDARGLAPDGWHVPSDTEWTILTDYLGGEALAGDKMKSKSGWPSYDGQKACVTCNKWDDEYRSVHSCVTCKDTKMVACKLTGNNSSGFNGLPGGFRADFGSFLYVGFYGNWWSSSEYDTLYGWFRNLYYGSGLVGRDSNNKLNGFSVRCLRD